MISISAALQTQMIQYCNGKYPEEACGALLGQTNGDRIYIYEMVGITNSSERPHHFFIMNPQQWISLLYASSRDNKSIVGIFHSHINTPAEPSADDLQTLWHQLPSYWIISLMKDKEPAVRAYKLSHNAYIDLPFTSLTHTI